MLLLQHQYRQYPENYNKYVKIKIYLICMQGSSLNTIANPTSAFFRAGPSLVPSPVTATTSLCSFNLLSIIPLTRVYLSVGEERARTRSLGHTLSRRCCCTYENYTDN